MRAAYRQWHEVLSAEFFGDDHAHRSIVLYVDDETEKALADRNGIKEGLAQAVASELNWINQGKPLFCRVQDACGSWTRGGAVGPPPSLPVLALSVLAATRMASSDGMLKSNFYGRWGQVFGEEPRSPRANRLEHSFPDVAAMWEQLDTWLKQTLGLYGTSTISTDDFYWKIGYPISQALIRGSDREVLTRFFAATRLQPRNPNQASGRELLRRLRMWTAGRDRHLSHRLLSELENAPDIDDTLIASLLRRLADDWDGTLHEPERAHRRRALGLRLMVADNGKRLEWLAEVVPGLPEVEVGLPGGRSFVLREEYGGMYGGMESLTPSHQQLAHGIRLEGETLVLEWAPQEVILLRKHPQLGDWASTEYFEPGEQHWILAADPAVRDVRSMIGALGGRTVREVVAPAPGWKLFKGVRAVNGTAFTRTLDRGGPHVRVLEPQIRQRSELTGGLRIAHEYRGGIGVAGHFLCGGAPDLLLPSGEGPDGLVKVVLDDQPQVLRADPRIPFPLCVVPLEEGTHRVGTEDSSQVFTLHDGLHEGLPPGTGTLGYRCRGITEGELTEVDSTESAIRGAYAPHNGALPRPEIVRQTVLEAMLIAADGGVHRVKSQSVPTWMQKRLPQDALGPCLGLEVPEGYVWLTYRTSTRWSVRPLVSSDGIPPPSPSADDFAWAYAVLSAASRSRLPAWLDYVAAAEAVSGKRGTP
ncbi:hypothetical protein ACFYOV_15000 [Streptomyces sp. NPDC005931]|uniref:hypothetical protein n=1 Tax=Streptomyces sp. NPDC005931 TaxID=3364737 RepID=UPI0036BAB074